MPIFANLSHRKGFKSALPVLVVLSIYFMTKTIRDLDISDQTTSKQTTNTSFASSNQNITSIPENDADTNDSLSVNVDANIDAGDTNNQTDLDRNGGDNVVHNKSFDKLEQQIVQQQQQQQQQQPQKDPDATLLVALRGEFGNNMFIIINAWAFAKIAKEEFGFIFRIVFEEQKRDGNVLAKAKRTSAYIKKCMMSPTFFDADFELGNRLKDEGYFHEIKYYNSRFTNFTFQPKHIRNEIKILIDYLSNNTHLYSPTSRAAVFEDDASIVPVPMVRVEDMNIWGFTHPFYDDMRKEFMFDELKCCGKSLENPPASDETVLHLRNFYTEKSTRDLLRFRELDADRIASELLGQLKEGDKIALAGRNIEKDAQKNDTEAFGIVSAIKAKNLNLRFSPGTDAMEDFCFLTFAEKELIGNFMSTYFLLAALWARPANKLTRIYQLVHEAKDNRMVRFRDGFGNFTNVELQSRIRFQTYYSKDYPVTNNTMVSWKSYGGAKYWPEKPWQR